MSAKERPVLPEGSGFATVPSSGRLAAGHRASSLAALVTVFGFSLEDHPSQSQQPGNLQFGLYGVRISVAPVSSARSRSSFSLANSARSHFPTHASSSATSTAGAATMNEPFLSVIRLFLDTTSKRHPPELVYHNTSCVRPIPVPFPPYTSAPSPLP